MKLRIFAIALTLAAVADSLYAQSLSGTSPLGRNIAIAPGDLNPTILTGSSSNYGVAFTPVPGFTLVSGSSVKIYLTGSTGLIVKSGTVTTF